MLGFVLAACLFGASTVLTKVVYTNAVLSVFQVQTVVGLLTLVLGFIKPKYPNKTTNLKAASALTLLRVGQIYLLQQALLHGSAVNVVIISCIAPLLASVLTLNISIVLVGALVLSASAVFVLLQDASEGEKLNITYALGGTIAMGVYHAVQTTRFQTEPVTLQVWSDAVQAGVGYFFCRDSWVNIPEKDLFLILAVACCVVFARKALQKDISKTPPNMVALVTLLQAPAAAGVSVALLGTSVNLICLVLVLTGCAVSAMIDNPSTLVVPEPKKQGKKGEDGVMEYTLDEVADHNRKNDFWTVIDNSVYNMSGFVDRHPGGPLIIAAAGSDATEMFHNYHIQKVNNMKDGPRIVMKKFHIGKCINHKSPEMGAFYVECAERVSEKLEGLPRHPLRTKIAVWTDVVVWACCIFGSLYCDTKTSLWKIALCWCPLFWGFASRLKQDCHALCHTQIFAPFTTYIVEHICLALGPISLMAYSGSNRINMRHWINEAREINQYEFVFNRGPYEHQAVHHVMGASLEHDACAASVSGQGFLRLKPEEPWKWYHAYQTVPGYDWIIKCFFIFGSYTLQAPGRVNMAHAYLKEGEWDYFITSTIGVFMSLALWRLWTIPLRMGMEGIAFFFCGMVLTLYLDSNQPCCNFFFAQHVWDRHSDEDVVDQDWGRYNTWSSYSLWNDDMWWHPFFWFTDGACPATLTYHLEHTLFPGINYYYLPRIAAIIEDCATKHNIEYPKIANYAELRKIQGEFYEKYAKKPKKVD